MNQEVQNLSSSKGVHIADFPVFIGTRRRLQPTDELFNIGSDAHTYLSKPSCQPTLHTNRQTNSKEVLEYLRHKFECSTCHTVLPSSHLLELHVAEMHDSYFAAQAARRLPVYRCLVEECLHKPFTSIEERKQHLTDYHRFPRNYNFDRLHLRRKKGQIRPMSSNQKKSASPHDDNDDGYDASASELSGSEVEGLSQGLSRLAMAAKTSTVPESISFGHRSGGRGIIRGGRGRGRKKDIMQVE